MKELKLEEPIGNFIIKNVQGVSQEDGQYYHYSEVCKLLNLQKQNIKNLLKTQRENCYVAIYNDNYLNKEIASLCITAPEPPLK